MGVRLLQACACCDCHADIGYLEVATSHAIAGQLSTYFGITCQAGAKGHFVIVVAVHALPIEW